jgi:transposase
VREQLKDSYSENGRPSIDPELLLRILLVGYLYGITSERKLVEELRMHLAWRWFTGLGFDQEIPHHSTFSKNRHGRFQESKLFEQLFEQIVKQCVEVGLVQGKHLSVDGSFVEANASKESRIPREQLAEAAQVNQTVRQYLVELEQQNPIEDRFISKIRYRPPIPIPPMPRRAARRPGWDTTTTIWSTIQAA